MSHQTHFMHRHINKKKTLKKFDKFMLAAAFIYPATGIPQAVGVFRGDIEGVSLLSWLGFLIFVSLFLVYSIAHDIKPMIITYAMWWTIDAAVVGGILYYSVV